MLDIDKIENILSHNNKDNNQNQSNIDGIQSNNSHLSKSHRLRYWFRKYIYSIRD